MQPSSHEALKPTSFRLFNTLTRGKDAFAASGKIVTFYFCGPTVYDYVHIGNLRAYTFADLLRRYLEYLGFAVKMAMNVTDVDDKTITNSQKQGISLKDFTMRYEKAFFEDISALRIKPASVYPRATEHIGEMVGLINSLLKNGCAYKGDDGSIYFDISRFGGYGKLSKLKLQELKAGARIRHDEYTKDQMQDFALWKAYAPEDGGVFWNVIIGGEQIKGRPGWHIECSAMSLKHLGAVDIHGGGVDLIFPHHENEIAQSEGATGAQFAKCWVHCDHLIVDGKKMSKSLGNFFTLRDILAKGHSPVALRYLLLATHYRSQLNFTFSELEAAQRTVDNFNAFVRKLEDTAAQSTVRKLNETIELALYDAKILFEDHMNDDLNVPEALAALYRMFTVVNREIDERRADAASLRNVLGFLMMVDGILDIMQPDEPLDAEEARLIRERESFRMKKDYKKADALRKELQLRGVHVEDTPYGPRWRKRAI
ncbi:MAG: cysteine--tRNA ligase [Candidatus Aenigmarchaeota archaeon]|nr:cysteine--tRNA ligase [Candidatus Aenigmarchaeota archaeon]